MSIAASVLFVLSQTNFWLVDFWFACLLFVHFLLNK